MTPLYEIRLSRIDENAQRREDLTLRAPQWKKDGYQLLGQRLAMLIIDAVKKFEPEYHEDVLRHVCILSRMAEEIRRRDKENAP